MLRVGVVAADPAVRDGLAHVFAREPGVEVAPPAAAAHPDILILDIWPPSTDVAQACAGWHAAYPRAAIVAIVHRPTPIMLARVRRAGAQALWPKGDVRGLPGFALGLVTPPAAAVP